MQRLARCLSAIAVALVISVVEVRAEDAGFGFVDADSPLGKRAIELALPEFQRKVPDAEIYKITIVRFPHRAGVIFCKPGEPADDLGCAEDEGGRFEVELDPDFTRVIAARFSR